MYIIVDGELKEKVSIPLYSNYYSKIKKAQESGVVSIQSGDKEIIVTLDSTHYLKKQEVIKNLVVAKKKKKITLENLIKEFIEIVLEKKT